MAADCLTSVSAAPAGAAQASSASRAKPVNSARGVRPEGGHADAPPCPSSPPAASKQPALTVDTTARRTHAAGASQSAGGAACDGGGADTTVHGADADGEASCRAHGLRLEALFPTDAAKVDIRARDIFLAEEEDAKDMVPRFPPCPYIDQCTRRGDETPPVPPLVVPVSFVPPIDDCGTPTTGARSMVCRSLCHVGRQTSKALWKVTRGSCHGICRWWIS